jgi:orotate phosphoribosyltransferase
MIRRTGSRARFARIGAGRDRFPFAMSAVAALSRETMSDARRQLLAILRRKSVVYGDFTLASGKKSDFYCDARLTTLDPRGALFLGEVGWELVRAQAERLGVTPVAIGGLTMGADPVALAIAIGAARAGADLEAFSIRKQAKTHGRGKLIEGNFKPGDTVVVVDDTITTGGSTLEAIEKIRAEGGTVAFALVLVDRGEGGKEAIEATGVPVSAIFTRAEIDAAP